MGVGDGRWGRKDVFLRGGRTIKLYLNVDEEQQVYLAYGKMISVNI